MPGRGNKCPHCDSLTFKDNGSLHQCNRCGSVGWSWKHGISEVGKGRGKRCPNCDNMTLHNVGNLQTGQKIRRCAKCDYSLIEPKPDEA